MRVSRMEYQGLIQDQRLRGWRGEQMPADRDLLDERIYINHVEIGL